MNNKLINTIVESRLNQVLINELDSYLINDVKEAYNLQEIVNFVTSFPVSSNLTLSRYSIL